MHDAAYSKPVRKLQPLETLQYLIRNHTSFPSQLPRHQGTSACAPGSQGQPQSFPFPNSKVTGSAMPPTSAETKLCDMLVNPPTISKLIKLNFGSVTCWWFHPTQHTWRKCLTAATLPSSAALWMSRPRSSFHSRTPIARWLISGKILKIRKLHVMIWRYIPMTYRKPANGQNDTPFNS